MSTFYSILQPVFGDELYRIVHPDPDGREVATLYAVFSKVGGSVFGDLEGDGNLRRPRMQLSIYGIDSDEVDVKEALVIAAMEAANLAANEAVAARIDPLTATGALPNRAMGDSIEGYEKDTKRFVKHMEYYCWGQS